MSEFSLNYHRLLSKIMTDGVEVHAPTWQSTDVSKDEKMISRELRYVDFRFAIPQSYEVLQQWVQPNLPWAEDHFQERVSQKPYNPPPSHEWWPHAQHGNDEHMVGGQFSHTYPERIWPKYAIAAQIPLFHCQCGRPLGPNQHAPNFGIRYRYGDLEDVINLLNKDPLTRQAYLPIWFPEDTGAHHGQRVPCTLGYHFLCRDGVMDIVYPIRSCDLLRHFRDDVYMAARLCQWLCQQLFLKTEPGKLIMNISSLHIFRGDYDTVRYLIRKWDADNEPTYGAAV